MSQSPKRLRRAVALDARQEAAGAPQRPPTSGPHTASHPGAPENPPPGTGATPGMQPPVPMPAAVTPVFPSQAGPVPIVVAETTPGQRGGSVQRSGGSSVTARYRRRRSTPWVMLGCLTLGLGALAGFTIFALQEPELKLGSVEPQTAIEHQPLVIQVPVVSSGHSQLHFELVSGPPEATVHSSTGKFHWLPDEADGDGTFPVAVRVTAGGQQQTVSFDIQVREVNSPPEITPVAPLEVRYGETLDLALQAADPDLPTRPLRFELDGDAPQGLAVEASTGQLHWAPTEGQWGKNYTVTVRAVEVGEDPLSASVRVQLRLPQRPLHTVEQLAQQLRRQGFDATANKLPGATTEAFQGEAWSLLLDGESIEVYSYASLQDRLADQETVLPMADKRFGQRKDKLPVRLYGSGPLLFVYAGETADLVQKLKARFGSPLAVVSSTPAEPFPMPVAPKAEVESPLVSLDQALMDVYRRNRLLVPGEYPAIRKNFALRFEQQQQSAIRQGLADDYGAMYAWFEAHPEVKEELFNAFCPQDDVTAGLALFNELRKQYPDLLADYANLAIALAVTWDKPGAVYGYDFHARRTQAIMPDELAGALDHFEYYTGTEKYMGGRVRYVPWEFLTYLVNHRTPLDERSWAMREYLVKRPMIGKCYHDVPYDQLMLQTNDRECRLKGKPYTLTSIRQHGGVCAMQADFAARVGQSVGVPAIYVGGVGANGANHAWVMWVEIHSATPNSLQFTLESSGRYQIDNYYVGNFRNPQTGQRTTDRETELRLQTVGANYQAKRQADLVMRFFPQLREQAELSPKQQLIFLRDLTNLCPGNEAAWQAMAQLVRDGQLDKSESRVLKAMVERMFLTFKNVPDFTLTVFDDMVAFVDEGKPRNELYLRLIEMYGAAKRPDLACEARLKLTDILLAQQQPEAAVEGLAATIKRFPGEGNYIPRMLDKIEQVCGTIEGTEPLIIKFYTEYLPLVPKKRGNEVSDYCVAIYTRAIKRFEQAGRTDLAQAVSLELQRLQAGGN